MYLGPRSQRGRRIHQNHSGSISSNLKKINEGKRVENSWACKDEWRWLLDASVTAGCWCGGCDGSCAINTCASIGFSISSNSHKDCQLSERCNIIQNHPNLSNQGCPSNESNATRPVFWCCFNFGSESSVHSPLVQFARSSLKHVRGDATSERDKVCLWNLSDVKLWALGATGIADTFCARGAGQECVHTITWMILNP